MKVLCVGLIGAIIFFLVAQIIWMCLVAKKMKENERKWDRKRRKRYEPGCASEFSIICVFFHK